MIYLNPSKIKRPIAFSLIFVLTPHTKMCWHISHTKKFWYKSFTKKFSYKYTQTYGNWWLLNNFNAITKYLCRCYAINTSLQFPRWCLCEVQIMRLGFKQHIVWCILSNSLFLFPVDGIKSYQKSYVCDLFWRPLNNKKYRIWWKLFPKWGSRLLISNILMTIYQ